MAKQFLLHTVEGNRLPISRQMVQAGLISGKFVRMIDNSLVCVIRKRIPDTPPPEDRRYHLGGGRLRNPFSGA